LDRVITDHFGLPLTVWNTEFSDVAGVFGVPDVPVVSLGSLSPADMEPLGFHDIRKFVANEGNTIPWDLVQKFMKNSLSVLHILLCRIRAQIEQYPSIPPKSFSWMSTRSHPDARGKSETLSMTRRRICSQIIQDPVHSVKSLLKDVTYLPLHLQLKRSRFYKVSLSKCEITERGDDGEPRKGKVTFNIVDGALSERNCGEGTWLMIPEAQFSYPDLISEICIQKLYDDKHYIPRDNWIITSFESMQKGDVTLTTQLYRKGLSTSRQFNSFIILPWHTDTKYARHWKETLDEKYDAHDERSVPVEEITSQPIKWAKVPFCDEMNKVKEKALEILGSESFEVFRRLSKTQRDTIENILSSHVSVLWGLPQTGTTSVLATLLVLLARATHEKRKECENEEDRDKYTLRVFFSAISDQLMDHFLDEIKKKRDQMGMPSTDLPVGMMNRSICKIQAKDGYTREPKDFFSTNSVFVAAGSVWQMRKPIFSDGKPYDIVVLDEASLYKTKDAVITVCRLDRKRSRLIVAGDPVQSPGDESYRYVAELSLVNGCVTKDGILRVSEPPQVTKSIFDCLLASPQSTVMLNILNESWSLNGEICDFLWREFYKPVLFPLCRSFHPASTAVASSSLAVTISSASEIVRFAFDPSKKLAVILFPWDRIPTCEDSHLEINTVIELYQALRQCPEMDDRRISENEFWSTKFMVAAINHSQRDAIKERLAALPGLSSTSPFVVETVHHILDKNREACLVDLAVSDSSNVWDDTNRFFNCGNLSLLLTRASKKCIVLLSEHVLCGWNPFCILGLEKWGQGLLFLRHLVMHAEANGCLYRVQPPHP